MLSSSENFQTNLEEPRLKSESDLGISNPDGWCHNRGDNFLDSSNYNAKRSSSKIFSDQCQPRLIIPLPVLLKDRLLISDKKNLNLEANQKMHELIPLPWVRIPDLMIF